MTLLVALGFLVGFTFVVSDPGSGEPLHISLPGGHRVELFACPFFAVTGLPCPICGITRSCALVLHGDIAGGFHEHPLGPALVLAAGGAVIWALSVFLRPGSDSEGRRDPAKPKGGRLVGLIVLMFLLASWAINLARHFGLVSW